MARRYRRYRRYRRTYYRKKKWTAFNSEVTVDTTSANQDPNLANQYFKEVIEPCVFGSSNSLNGNASPANSLSAINYYVCRCRYKGVFGRNIATGSSYICYIGFIPNAVTVNANQQQETSMANSFFYRHPEYILAWSRLDYVANSGDTGEVSLYSRVVKKIAPGDRIVMGVLARNVSGNAVPLSSLQGTFSCYLRTN